MVGQIYKKEMIDALRDRKTILLTILVPMITMLGLVFFYESMLSDKGEQYTIAVGQSLPSELEHKLKAIDEISVKTFAKPEQAVDDGKADVYLNVPKEFDSYITSMTSFEVDVYGSSVDQGSSNAMQLVQSALEQYKNEIVQERLTSKHIDHSVIQPFSVQQKEADEEQGVSAIMLSAILPMLLLTSIVSGAMPIALDIIAGEKDRKSIEALLLTPVSRNKVLVGKWLAVSTFGIASGVLSLIFLILCTVLFTEKLRTAFQLGDHLWVIIGASALIIVLSAMLIAAMELMISIISGTVKEAQSYMSLVVFLPIFPMFFIFNKAPNQIDLSYFFIPFLNLHALFKQLLFGMISPAAILYTCGTIVVLIAIFFLLARACFLKDKWVLPK
ncbi:ABC transporter permease [Bacillus halotolerans]|uniref:ABC transporter permease n=1 Tax=Bacillus halotolerans TaxID=260554 RepID=UPI00227FEFF2|nr:ABC transporter permease [Bacillus halotolerans]MCY8473765.1 ABC transporter permease [Bacillus halotolerans]